MAELFAQKIGRLQLRVHDEGGVQRIQLGIGEAIILLEEQLLELLVPRLLRPLPAQASPQSIQVLVKQFDHMKAVEHQRGLRKTSGRHGQVRRPGVAAHGGYLLAKCLSKRLKISQ